MEYALLRGHGTATEGRPIFMFALQPPLDNASANRGAEELALYTREYPDSSEFDFDEERLCDEAAGKMKELLESEGHTVRLLEREVEVDLDAELDKSLFEESAVLH